MNFEEWYKIYSGGSDNYMYTELGLQKTWNAALDEAVKVADIRDIEGQPLNPQMVEGIEALKYQRTGGEG